MSYQENIGVLIIFSDNCAVEHRIDLLSENISQQLRHLKLLKQNNFRIDQSVAYVQCYARFMVFVRYGSSENFNGEYSYCESLLKTTTDLYSGHNMWIY